MPKRRRAKTWIFEDRIIINPLEFADSRIVDVRYIEFTITFKDDIKYPKLHIRNNKEIHHKRNN